jgi:pimeloyl-ACP methyl ester carboxylesterase
VLERRIASMTESGYADLFVSASDGLALHARDYGPRLSSALPVVCLPGLTRNSTDFHHLARVLAGDAERPRRVLALDYRGRGLSAYDLDWRRYDLRVELNDVLQVLTAAGVSEAVLVGTSRGGLLTMALCAARPALLRAAVLNDIGPVIENAGLARIRGYVGKLPEPRDLADGARILRERNVREFPGLSEEAWRFFAGGSWREEDGRVVLSYDRALMRTLEPLDLTKPQPPLWSLFEGLKRVPLLLLRGENSDLLSAETLDAMARVHPSLEAITVPGQGHAPLLLGDDLLVRIRTFIVRIEAIHSV